MASRKRSVAVSGDPRARLTADLLAFRDLLDRAIAAQRVSHFLTLAAPSGDGLHPYGLRRGNLEEAILLSHLWPDGDGREYPPFTQHAMEREIPAPLLDALLAGPPATPAVAPTDDDHAREWACYLAHRAPEIDDHDDYDALLGSAEQYAARRQCPVFRRTLAGELIAARQRARALSTRHGVRFRLDRYGRLIVPAQIPAPQRWIGRAVLRSERDTAVGLGEIDHSGYQLVTLEIRGRTPEDRARLRADGIAGLSFGSSDDDESVVIQTRTILGVATLYSEWKWCEPADGERVPVSRVPAGAIIQRVHRGAPGELLILHRHRGRLPAGLQPDTIVIYRRRDALPEAVCLRLMKHDEEERVRDVGATSEPVAGEANDGKDGQEEEDEEEGDRADNARADRDPCSALPSDGLFSFVGV